MRDDIVERIHALMVPVQRPPFLDITPIFSRDPEAFEEIIEELAAPHRAAPPDCVVCVESMGYLFGVPVARKLGVRFVVARKGGKLPQEVIGEDYDVVYSKGQRVEVTADAIDAGDRVLIVDDILANGGTAQAIVNLVDRSGASVLGVSVFMEVHVLPGRSLLEGQGHPVHAVIAWPRPEADA
jgi:adenine phosphoribosyltransferase